MFRGSLILSNVLCDSGVCHKNKSFVWGINNQRTTLYRIQIEELGQLHASEGAITCQSIVSVIDLPGFEASLEELEYTQSNHEHKFQKRTPKQSTINTASMLQNILDMYAKMIQHGSRK